MPADAVGVEVNITAIQNEGRGSRPCIRAPRHRPDGVDVELHAGCEHRERHHRCAQRERRSVHLHLVHRPLRPRRRRLHPRRLRCGDGGAGSGVGHAVERVRPSTASSLGAGKVQAGTFTKVQIAGRGGVPADAVGVEVNITAIQNEGRGFATLYPCTATPPVASTLNYTPGVNIANATTVALNADGEVCIFTSSTAHYALDVVAYIPAGSDVTTVEPGRVLDTRRTGSPSTASRWSGQTGSRQVHQGADRRAGRCRRRRSGCRGQHHRHPERRPRVRDPVSVHHDTTRRRRR